MNLKFVAPMAGAIIVLLAVAVYLSSTTENVSTSEVATPEPEISTAELTSTEEKTTKVELDVSSTELTTAEENMPLELENLPAESTTSEEELMITDGKKHLISLDKIKGGGPPKDGIPSIDDPKFVDAIDADFVSDTHTVIGLEINGESKAYPLFILVWHEIVNDKVGGTPVSVTYCPLCYTNQVFERIIDGKEVEFGTSGKLYNSNLVMYDRLTDSYWSQALGKAITGELTGQELKIIPFDVITWGDWKTIHPDSKILTTETGHLRAYGVDPYGDYYTDPRIIFPVDNKDERLHPKEIILGFRESGIYKAYGQNDVEHSAVINDKVADTPL
ncbi:MAG: DUF3179 domain-containing protein, partial [Nitrosopumilaceae archaeon]